MFKSCSIGLLYISIKTSTDWGLNCSGWWYTYPSEKYARQLGLLFPIYGKKTSCSKPPTRNKLCIFPRQVVVNHQKVRSWPMHGSAKHMKTWLVVDLPTIGW